MNRRTVPAALAAPVALWAAVHLQSPAVQTWQRSELGTIRVGRLACRTGGSGPTAAVLLHGLVATGDVFGRSADALAKSSVVAVPDLLGFGGSVDEHATDFGSEAHLAAIDLVVDQVCGDRPVLLGAHSMGSTLALRWAARNPERVRAIVCIGAPMWSSRVDAIDHLHDAGGMARALLLDDRVARRLCRFNCAHRTLSGWIAAALAPRWPALIARQASLHTWAAFHQAIQCQVLHEDWCDLLTHLDGHGVPVTLIWGDGDPVGDQGYAQRLALDLQRLTVEVVAGADHTLPAARPDLLPLRLQEHG